MQQAQMLELAAGCTPRSRLLHMELPCQSSLLHELGTNKLWPEAQTFACTNPRALPQ